MRWRHAWLTLVLSLGALAGAQAAELRLEGRLVQGGLMHGRTAPGSAVALDGRAVRVAADGRFVFGFGRDAAAGALLVVRAPDGREERRHLEVAVRTYRITRIDGLPPRQVTPSERDLARIQAEAKLIDAATARDGDGRGFAEPVAWPALGRISGIYGSQRILNGEPRSPHRGLDIAAPAGTQVGAMASGVVSLAESDLYFTGATVMIDHGHGLHSIYCHLQDVLVAVGQRLTQGERLGTIGASGRATGPHLHWGVYWFEHAIDPALLVGPMPQPGW